MRFPKYAPTHPSVQSIRILTVSPPLSSYPNIFENYSSFRPKIFETFWSKRIWKLPSASIQKYWVLSFHLSVRKYSDISSPPPHPVQNNPEIPLPFSPKKIGNYPHFGPKNIWKLTSFPNPGPKWFKKIFLFSKYWIHRFKNVQNLLTFPD